MKTSKSRGDIGRMQALLKTKYVTDRGYTIPEFLLTYKLEHLSLFAAGKGLSALSDDTNKWITMRVAELKTERLIRGE